MEQFIEITTLDDRKNQINMVTMCAWCGRLKLPGQKATEHNSWVRPDRIHVESDSTNLYISHGLCPHCKSTFI